MHACSTHGIGVSTDPPFASNSARFFLNLASSMHWSSELRSRTTSRRAMMSSKFNFQVRSSWSTIWLRKFSSTSGLYCAAVGKQEAKLADEHFSSVAFTAWLKILMRPCARGPGVAAMGGAGVGDGEREAGCVVAGMFA